MADSKTCKWKIKPNWTQEQLLLLAQLVNENKDIIKGKFEITSKTKGDIFLKAQIFLKCLRSEAEFSIVCGLVLVIEESSSLSYNLSQI